MHRLQDGSHTVIVHYLYTEQKISTNDAVEYPHLTKKCTVFYYSKCKTVFKLFGTGLAIFFAVLKYTVLVHSVIFGSIFGNAFRLLQVKR